MVRGVVCSRTWGWGGEVERICLWLPRWGTRDLQWGLGFSDWSATDKRVCSSNRGRSLKEAQREELGKLWREFVGRP